MIGRFPSLMETLHGLIDPVLPTAVITQCLCTYTKSGEFSSASLTFLSIFYTSVRTK